MNDAAERRGYWLGGSDIAPILGRGRFKTNLDVYLEKRGEAPPTEETQAMRWGTILEDDVADEWARLQGVKIRRRNKAMSHPERRWLRGHFDRVIVGQKEGVEIKVASQGDYGDQGTDEVPVDCLLQCMTYLLVSGFARWHVAALLWGGFGPPSLNHYVIEPDPDLFQVILDKGSAFVQDHLIPGVPPEPTTNEQASKLWKGVRAGEIVVATDEHVKMIADREAWKAQIRGLERRMAGVELKLKTALTNREAFVDADGTELLRWPVEFSRRFDSSTFQKEHPETYVAYCQTTHARIFRLTKEGRAAIKPKDDEQQEKRP